MSLQPEVPSRHPALSSAAGSASTRKIPNGVIAMVIFVITEIIFFTALISSFMIAAASSNEWPPLGQPRLPVAETLLNTAALLFSGVMLVLAHRRFRAGDDQRGGRWLLGSVLLGVFFVAFQGAEWVQLIGEGLTLTSSRHGSFFYLIVGMHALHAIVAVSLLVWMYLGHRRGTMQPTRFYAVQIFWYFVVLVWPFIYLVVYQPSFG